MRWQHFPMIVVGLISFVQVGCGTLHNLHAPPVAQETGPCAIGSGPGICVPFGGVARSALLGFVGAPIGVGEAINGGNELIQGNAAGDGFSRIGNGLKLAGIGVIAVLDTPLSLAGDFVTWPVAYARQHQQPWATWWGKEPGRCWLGRMFQKGPTSEDDIPLQLETPSKTAEP
jgi:hypothetical protein